MAEQQTTEEPQVLKDFGDINEAFDKAFPKTAAARRAAEAEAQNQAEPAQPAQPAQEPALETPPSGPDSAQQEAAEPPKPDPTIQGTPKDDLPDFLTGKPPETKPEPEAPKEPVGIANLRTAYENLKKETQRKEQEYQTQLEALKKAPPVAPDAEATIANLEAKVAELSTAVERTAIEFHPAFRQEFVDKRTQMVNEAHQILKEAGVEPAAWDRAMALNGNSRTEALEELYTDLPRAVVSELGSTAREIRSLDSRRDAYLANSKELQQRLQRDDLQRQHMALKEHEKRTLHLLDSAEHDLVDRLGLEVYRKSDNPDHARWNESVDKMKTDARKLLLETTDPSVMAAAALLAPAALQYRHLYHTMRDRWLEVDKKLKEYEKAEPTSETRGTPTPSAEGKNVKFADAVARSVFGA